MKFYEVTVRKVVEESVIVKAKDRKDAEYKGTCQASDGDTIEILEVKDIAFLGDCP